MSSLSFVTSSKSPKYGPNQQPAARAQIRNFLSGRVEILDISSHDETRLSVTREKLCPLILDQFLIVGKECKGLTSGLYNKSPDLQRGPG